MRRLTKQFMYGLGHKDCYDACSVCGVAECCDSLEEMLEKLAHFEDLEEQGKLMLFPYLAYFIKDGKVQKGWVQETVHAVSRKPLYDIRYDDNSLASYRGYLGNTVFLTKKEAEAKLKEMEGAENDS